jgi:hypothetical protein
MAGTMGYDAERGVLQACVKLGSSFGWFVFAGGTQALEWHASVAGDWEGKTDKYVYRPSENNEEEEEEESGDPPRNIFSFRSCLFSRANVLASTPPQRFSQVHLRARRR